MAAWADTRMTLTSNEVVHVLSLNDRLDIAEVEGIYLPLSRVLSLYVRATQNLFPAQQRFLGTEFAKLPYIKRTLWQGHAMKPRSSSDSCLCDRSVNSK